jgi:nicotinate-nucleotide pyrophosphorylase (carboxylating)
VLAGLDVAFECFRLLEPDVQISAAKADGQRCGDGEVVAEISGLARTLLIGERTALNFLQRLSGIATMTNRFVDAARGRVTVLDTRKTTPTLRVLEKYAVRAGGGKHYRFGLFDAVLIKDNHIALAGGVASAILQARSSHPALPVEVEADTLDQVREALGAGADTILLDNMTTDDIRTAVSLSQGHVKLEISGGVTLARMPELAATGADYVSVGALTHSAPAVDIGFDIAPL